MSGMTQEAALWWRRLVRPIFLAMHRHGIGEIKIAKRDTKCVFELTPEGAGGGDLADGVDQGGVAPCAQLAESMMAWSRAWKLDGDLCRCRKCNRAIIISRSEEAFRHAAECPQAHLIAPWQDLRSRIPANSQAQPSVAGDVPVKPICFGSNPGPQSRAENECWTCQFEKTCQPNAELSDRHE